MQQRESQLSPRGSFHALKGRDSDSFENVSSASTKTLSSERRYYKIPDPPSRFSDESVELVPVAPVDAQEIRTNWDNLTKEELVDKFVQASSRWLYAFPDIDLVIKPSTADEFIRSNIAVIQLSTRNFQLDRFDLASINKGWKTCIYEGSYLLYEFARKDILYDIDPRSEITYHLQINKILEVVDYCGKSMLNLYHARVAFDPNYDYSMNDDISLSRFSPMDYSKNSPYQDLLLYLLSTLYQRGLRRYKDYVYSKIFSNDGYFTYAWKQLYEIQGFVYESIQKEVNFQQWFNATSNHSNIDKVVKHLSNCKDKEFPELKKNRHIFSFKNGVYVNKLEGPKGELYDGFYRFGEQPTLPSNMVACKYFETNFEPFDLFECKYGSSDTLKKINDESWYEDIPTPNFQKILEYQFKSHSDYHEISKWMYTLIGRLLFDVGECDSWQVFPYFQGIAGTGKGTILKIPAMFYEPEDIATLENTTEKVFGLEGLYDKYIFIAAELKDNLNIDQAKFQKMISGEDVSVAIKNKTAKSVIWKTPGAGAGNTTIFQDNSGSISRRFVTFMFDKKVRKGDGDPMLEKKLHDEVPRLLLKCTRAYCSAVNKYSKKDLWNVLPKYFLDIKDTISQETNVIKHFLSSGRFEFGEGYLCTEREFKLEFNVHCRENNLGKFKISPTIYDEPFGEFSEKFKTDIRYIKKYSGTKDGVKYNGAVITGLRLRPEEAPDTGAGTGINLDSSFPETEVEL